MSKPNALVIFGGVSSEHEVSRNSAASVIDNFPVEEFSLITVGITKTGSWLLYNGDTDAIRDGSFEQNSVSCTISPDRQNGGIIVFNADGSATTHKIDVAFPVLHGKNGEDGTMQGLLEIAGIPYVGPGVLSSSMCMDKIITNLVLEHSGFAHTKWDYITKNDRQNLSQKINEFETNLAYPIFVKPANAGSSVGITKAEDRQQLEQAIDVAFLHDDRVLLEQSVVGRELECAVLGNDSPFASRVSEIIPTNAFYDYEAKYVNASETVLPANIPEQLEQRIRETAVLAYKAMCCKGMSRVDFFYQPETDSLMINEINTIPGFTSISMYPRMITASGIEYNQLILKLLKLAMENKND